VPPRYIEQWGSGILNAIGECKTMGLPEPIFEEFAFRFRATISLVPEQEPELDDVTQKIRAALSTAAGKKSGLSSQQIAEEVGQPGRDGQVLGIDDRRRLPGPVELPPRCHQRREIRVSVCQHWPPPRPAVEC